MKFSAKEVAEELIARGFDAEETDVVKNGVTFHGVVLKNGAEVMPVFYVENYEGTCGSVSEVADRICDFCKNAMKYPDSVKKVMEREWVLDHLYIGLQKSSAEELVKRPSFLEGIEEYLLAIDDSKQGGAWSAKMKRNALDSLMISEEDAWKKAIANTKKGTVMKGLAETLGMPADGLIPIQIMTNGSMYKGAGAISNKEALETLSKEWNVERLIVIPSSIHEVLLSPFTDEEGFAAISGFVSAVNRQEVAPEEQLADRAFILDVRTLKEVPVESIHGQAS